MMPTEDSLFPIHHSYSYLRKLETQIMTSLLSIQTAAVMSATGTTVVTPSLGFAVVVEELGSSTGEKPAAPMVEETRVQTNGCCCGYRERQQERERSMCCS
ncbi:conserved hypothetical protein [Ricinus communis]|uniref:Uncharacterized protein n=1 Tax=Ricinus communis TaxID=3988 RepID=B9SK77_RICCO|nr:conserved hypothetical protein [Ricinus communis]